ncbi:hypothetical protein F7725_017776 [Dissostichus mawsoni]|uniref:Uncharacterized protein n=1 Tax=Dissostichus mawsoni TaxID=36200 RepID=A0A7J5XR57_DISMA|nr:hypothetical protein F7725_017776 [Dissostichus mawsoni]
MCVCSAVLAQVVPLGDLPAGVLADLGPVLGSGCFRAVEAQQQSPQDLVLGGPVEVHHQELHGDLGQQLGRDVVDEGLVEDGVQRALLHAGDVHLWQVSSFQNHDAEAKPRFLGRGGGLAVIHRAGILVKELPVPTTTSFECVVFKLARSAPLQVALIYRPPKASTTFLSELSELLTSIAPCLHQLANCGPCGSDPHVTLCVVV